MNRFKVSIAAVSVMLAVATTMTGCSASTSAGPGASSSASTYNKNAKAPALQQGVVDLQEAEPGSGKGLTVGFTQLLLAVSFPQAVQKGMEEQAQRAGLKLVTCDSKGDAGNALACARQFKSQGVDGLVTFQADANSSPAICAAGPKVPVIAVDIEQKPCQVSFSGTPNSYAGQISGYNLGQYFGKKFDCKYDAFISLESKAVGEVNTLRMKGIRDAFENVCGKIHDLRVLDAGAGGLAATAQTAVANTLTALPGRHRIIVVGINEDTIIGALAAARASNRTNDLYINPQGLDPKNCQILTNKNWVGSTEYFPEKYGQLIIPNIIKAIKGEKIPTDLLMPDKFIDSSNIKQYYPDYSCS